MAKRNGKKTKTRRIFDDEFKEQALQMMLDGHSASSVSERLGIGNTNLLYRWKQEILAKSGSAAETLDSKVRGTSRRASSCRTRTRHIKKALAIFSRNT